MLKVLPPWQCPSSAPAPAPLLRLRARLVALGGSTLSCEELSPTTSGARARRLQSHRFHRLRPSRCACPRGVASRCSVVAGRRRVGAGRRRPRRGSGHRASFASRTRRSCTERGTITLRRAGACCTPNPSLTRARARARARAPSPSLNPSPTPSPNQVRATLQRVASGPDTDRGARHHGSARCFARLRGGTAHCA